MKEDPREHASSNVSTPRFVVDGTNVGRAAQGSLSPVAAIGRVRETLCTEYPGSTVDTITDASFRYVVRKCGPAVEKEYEAARQAGLIRQAPSEADEFILWWAQETGAVVISNDRFKDHAADRMGVPVAKFMFMGESVKIRNTAQVYGSGDKPDSIKINDWFDRAARTGRSARRTEDPQGKPKRPRIKRPTEPAVLRGQAIAVLRGLGGSAHLGALANHLRAAHKDFDRELEEVVGGRPSGRLSRFFRSHSSDFQCLGRGPSVRIALRDAPPAATDAIGDSVQHGDLLRVLIDVLRRCDGVLPIGSLGQRAAKAYPNYTKALVDYVGKRSGRLVRFLKKYPQHFTLSKTDGSDIVRLRSDPKAGPETSTAKGRQAHYAQHGEAMDVDALLSAIVSIVASQADRRATLEKVMSGLIRTGWRFHGSSLREVVAIGAAQGLFVSTKNEEGGVDLVV